MLHKNNKTIEQLVIFWESKVSISNFKKLPHSVLIFLLMTLNIPLSAEYLIMSISNPDKYLSCSFVWKWIIKGR